jgi:hypothetical protein
LTLVTLFTLFLLTGERRRRRCRWACPHETDATIEEILVKVWGIGDRDVLVLETYETDGETAGEPASDRKARNVQEGQFGASRSG